MKKIFRLVVVASVMLSASGQVYGQSLKDIFNSSVVKNVVNAVTGGSSLTVENLTGTWSYTKPAVQLESDNTLKNVAGSVATSELEKKLKTYCTKAGIVEGLFSYTFNSDSTFTNTLKGKTIKGTYSLNSDGKTIALKYTFGETMKVTTLTANVVISGSSLSLLFKADKMLDLITKISSLTDNTTLTTISKLAGQYDGLMLGFELKK
jgi:hypothetical protein